MFRPELRLDNQREAKMKWVKLLLATVFFTSAVGNGAPAFASPYGLSDSHGVWRDADYWHAHHPEWAEAHPGWIRDDHGRHPEWFHSAYWSEHPRDWNHPYEEYRRELSRNIEYQHSHPAGVAAANNHEDYHGGSAVTEHQNAAAGQYHAPETQYHAPATSSAYHPSVSTGSAIDSASGGGHSEKH